MEHTVIFTSQVWKDLQMVNRRINDAIIAQPDAPGQDIWNSDIPYGDCDEYMLTKRKRLIEAGYPVSSLTIMWVTTSWGEGHVVLVVETDRGRIVLDNLEEKIYFLEQMKHTFVKQSTFDPLVWTDKQ